MTDDEWATLTANYDFVRWGITCRMMMTRIVQGQMEGAHEALRYFCRQPRRELVTVDSGVSLAFDVRIANALEQGGYYDVDSVRMAADQDLLEIGGLSIDTIDAIRRTIADVMEGKVYETYGELDVDALIDEELSVRSLPSQQPPALSEERPLVRQAERICEAKKDSTMTNEEQVISALDLLMASPDTASEAIDKQIARCEKEIDKYKADIARLRKMQRTFGLGESKAPKAKSGGQRASVDWGPIIEKVRIYVKANGGAKPGTIAKHCELTPIQVGMAVNKTNLLKKDLVTGFVVLAS